jgi:glycosyltransferase involved in cell wall biosynthesis
VFLSIIIPAYNEENRLPATLEQVSSFLSSQNYSSELLVVNNNSTDQTEEIIKHYAQKIPFLRGLFEAQPGKGAAVRTGMLAASGEYRFMADADLSMPIEEIASFLPPRLEALDLAIASREAPGAVRYHEPEVRHLGGRLMNWLIQLLILPGLNDTQCGFKCFSAAAAEDLFQHQTLAGWSFDIELLALARRRGYTIKEIPISWYYHEESKIHAVRDAFQMIGDILTIRRNISRGIYDPED